VKGEIMVGPDREGELKLEIKNQRPIDLLVLTSSLAALGDEYLRHLEFEDHEAAASEVRLYVTEVHTGSIMATLMAASPQIIEAGTHALSVVSFTEKLHKAYSFLRGIGKKPENLDRHTLTNLNRIVEPIARDQGSQLNIGNNYAPITFNITYADANHAQNTISRLLAEEKTPTTRYHESVLLYWYQARNDPNSAAGDRGIIESIYDGPVRVVCVNDNIKREMLLEIENPFREAFLVDVAVETIKGKPAVYKVMRLHEKIPRSD
jgi:hypothetical protein